MKIKSILALVLTGAVALSMASCGQGGSGSSGDAKKAKAEYADTLTAYEEEEQESSDDGDDYVYIDLTVKDVKCTIPSTLVETDETTEDTVYYDQVDANGNLQASFCIMTSWEVFPVTTDDLEDFLEDWMEGERSSSNKIEGGTPTSTTVAGRDAVVTTYTRRPGQSDASYAKVCLVAVEDYIVVLAYQGRTNDMSTLDAILPTVSFELD